MSHLVSRILLAVFLIPAAAIVYFLLFFFLAVGRNWGAMANVVAGTITWVFIAAYWGLLWRSSVEWNSRRIVGAFAAAAILAIAGTVLGILAEAALAFNENGTFGAFFGSVFAPIAWLIATVFLWRETTQERRARVSSLSTKAIACPTCGYNLTGLTATRCPECGKQSTLDELFAAQVSPVGEEIEPS
jgi:hypothetical protein